MNTINNGRKIGGFTRGDDIGKLKYELIPQELYDILHHPVDGCSLKEMAGDLHALAYDFRFKEGDHEELVRGLIYDQYRQSGYAEVLQRMAKLYTAGAEVHGENNWKQGTSLEALKSFRESFYRHYISYKVGDSMEDHFAACLFNLLGASHCVSRLND